MSSSRRRNSQRRLAQLSRRGRSRDALLGSCRETRESRTHSSPIRQRVNWCLSDVRGVLEKRRHVVLIRRERVRRDVAAPEMLQEVFERVFHVFGRAKALRYRFLAALPASGRAKALRHRRLVPARQLFQRTVGNGQLPFLLVANVPGWGLHDAKGDVRGLIVVGLAWEQ